MKKPQNLLPINVPLLSFSLARSRFIPSPGSTSKGKSKIPCPGLLTSTGLLTIKSSICKGKKYQSGSPSTPNRGWGRKRRGITSSTTNKGTSSLGTCAHWRWCEESTAGRRKPRRSLKISCRKRSSEPWRSLWSWSESTTKKPNIGWTSKSRRNGTVSSTIDWRTTKRSTTKRRTGSVSSPNQRRDDFNQKLI